MFRRTLFSLPLAAVARAEEKEPTPAIQYQLINTPAPVDVPAASGAWTRCGIGVQVYSDQPNTEAFIVTVRYWAPSLSAIAEQTKVVPRQRDAVIEPWTALVFWTGEPVQVREIRARELVFAGHENTIRGEA